MNKIEYKEYLGTPHWQKTKKQKVAKKSFCSVCGFSNVDIHHLNYENIGCEKMQDLIRLCRDCHFTLHDLLNSGKVKLKNKPISIDKLRERTYFSQVAIIKLAIKKARGFGHWTKGNHFTPHNMFI